MHTTLIIILPFFGCFDVFEVEVYRSGNSHLNENVREKLKCLSSVKGILWNENIWFRLKHSSLSFTSPTVPTAPTDI